ncbi:hypothetical protein BKA65DRAFT_551116 [Rhexocercosporidium sp. MPI-PUGE-AT-0058]|nr:hypothetical protein BKA65DRAFT_551116 [Rhexocercosporidium sp. MPI-PUGE-AT-0058]
MATSAKAQEDQVMIVAPSKISLNTFPDDVLFQLFRHLPSSSFDVLAHTCHALRRFVKENGQTICNITSGWLVPTAKGFSMAEKSVRQLLAPVKIPRYILRSRIVKVRKLKNAVSKVTLALPGPLLLAFLEVHGLPIRRMSCKVLSLPATRLESSVLFLLKSGA